MNIKQFIAYKANCPACGSILNTTFESQNRKIIRYENNRMVVQSDLIPLKKKKEKSYKIFHSMGMEDNSFFIDFATENGQMYKHSVSLEIIEKYREYDKNTKSYLFYRSCNACCQYQYRSLPIIFNHKYSFFSNPKVHKENLQISRVSKNNMYKIYCISNDYYLNTTQLVIKIIDEFQMKNFLKEKTFNHKFYDENIMQISLLKLNFKSKEDFMGKIDKLMLFS